MRDNHRIGIRDRQRSLGLIGGATAASAVGGGFLGYGLTHWAGLEAVTVLEMAIPLSPLTVALYAGVTVSVFLVTLGLVTEAVSRFDD